VFLGFNIVCLWSTACKQGKASLNLLQNGSTNQSLRVQNKKSSAFAELFCFIFLKT
jgi:hypothetical protein